MSELRALVAEELGQAVDPRVAEIAEAIAAKYGKSSRAVLFYGSCLREKQPFGVVCLRQGSEVRSPGDEPVMMESTGVLASLQEVDAEQAGVLRVKCLGTRRFEIDDPMQQPDGLWTARAWLVEDDIAVAPSERMLSTVMLGAALLLVLGFMLWAILMK